MATTEISKALALAFAAIINAKKTSNNPHFKSNYADLSAILDIVREEYGKVGLSVMQCPGQLKDKDGVKVVEITTTVIHSSGEMLSSQMDMPVSTDKSGRITAQAVGSAITYGRRYALAAVAGIAQVDDDGNDASSGDGAEEERSVEELAAALDHCHSLAAVLSLKDEVSASGDAQLVAKFKQVHKLLKKAA